MATSNWIELAVLLLGIAAGILVWRVCKTKLKREGGMEGIITERGKPTWRQPLDVEDEIEQLKAALGEQSTEKTEGKSRK